MSNTKINYIRTLLHKKNYFIDMMNKIRKIKEQIEANNDQKTVLIFKKI